MAAMHSSLPANSAIGSRYSSSFTSIHATASLVSFPRLPETRRSNRKIAVTAMVQQAVQGAPAAYAKEMERLSAKESLLLAFKDSGGFEALVTGKTTDLQRIDVNERITGLERLNPTPRPTTSPFLEGRWNFEWFGSGSPGIFAARFILERFPSNLANLSKMDVLIKDSNAKITASMKLLSSIESKFILSTRLSVEGPLRMREEYVEGILETPKIIEETVPEQLKGALDQAVSTVQQLPVPIRDAVSSGLKVPLPGSFQRFFMISYLDEEIIIIRDTAGVPEVLTRLDAPTSPIEESSAEYES
ncbi:hypothetical protein P3X46_004390 [Hevea brasiliensis]|uniref:Plastid lipid-associated protein/fibrillin conserved domain-containing protein n=1 Tax=Hevea brasiliensis TaxID=3981 RepID=A0ABQ9MWL4_HEVBR|nr:probable plastid-lipid-associated protein 13, chloroplastic [Hevea brasiliensis]KAJ9184687.1 hypothetical protein P3X46_004390 [Hevea brasiliensis]